MHRAGGAEAGTRIVHADHEEAVGIERLAGADHVVPPALALGLAFVGAGHMVRRVQRVADQHCVRAVRVQRAIGFVHQRVVGQHRAALQGQRLGKVHGLWCDDAYGFHDELQIKKPESAGCRA